MVLTLETVEVRRVERVGSGTLAMGPRTESVAEASAAELRLLPAELIGGDETIIFAIKPSLWYILFDSARWVVGALLVVMGAGLVSEAASSLTETQVMSGALAAVGIRIGVALLRWASRFYVLTNRRVMRVSGVFQVEVFESPLLKIRNTGVTRDFMESFAQLGTIQLIFTDPEGGLGRWRNIRDPDAVHAEVRRAIERAIDSQPHI
jgi:hypothetical protein